MRAALYARRSDDDDAKSVSRQVAHSRAYAERKGWTVAEGAIFVSYKTLFYELAARVDNEKLVEMSEPAAKHPVR